MIPRSQTNMKNNNKNIQINESVKTDLYLLNCIKEGNKNYNCHHIIEMIKLESHIPIYFILMLKEGI